MGAQVAKRAALSGAVRRDIRKVARPERAASQQWFFKTGPGEYGAGDRFLGVTVPQLRTIAREYRDMPLKYVVTLLQSPWHEERLLALFILVGQYVRADTRTRQTIHQLYLRNTKSINNWDLVDSSAAQIVGAHLADRRSPSAATACPIEIRLGAAHRDDRDLSLHPAEGLQGRPGHCGAAAP